MLRRQALQILASVGTFGWLTQHAGATESPEDEDTVEIEVIIRGD